MYSELRGKVSGFEYGSAKALGGDEEQWECVNGRRCGVRVRVRGDV